MKWLALQPLSRVLIMALAWPTLLVGYAVAVVAWEYLKARRAYSTASTYIFVSIGTDGAYAASWVLTAVVVLGPSILLLVLWRVARRNHPTAT